MTRCAGEGTGIMRLHGGGDTYRCLSWPWFERRSWRLNVARWLPSGRDVFYRSVHLFVERVKDAILTKGEDVVADFNSGKKLSLSTSAYSGSLCARG